MKEDKFLRYCPKCYNYDPSTGACSYIHENVLQYPDKFISHCDGKYLSLINGDTIEPFYESDAAESNAGENEQMMVPVFSTYNNALFQVAKTILNDHNIKFYSRGDFLNVLEPAVYESEIKVFEKDAKAAEELLSEIAPVRYETPDKFSNFLTRFGILIILISLLIIMLILLLIKIF
ncbi:MAG: DUF2007 domain-containing protein [Ignavibacteria bacterium]